MKLERKSIGGTASIVELGAKWQYIEQNQCSATHPHCFFTRLTTGNIIYTSYVRCFVWNARWIFKKLNATGGYSVMARARASFIVSTFSHIQVHLNVHYIFKYNNSNNKCYIILHVQRQTTLIIAITRHYYINAAITRQYQSPHYPRCGYP